MRAASLLERAETLYLKVLRAALLVAATVLLILAAIWAVVGLSRVLRSPASVIEAPSAVAAGELAGAGSVPSAQRRGVDEPARALRAERSFYDDLARRYFALYQAKYQPSLRGEDKRLTVSEFDDLTINTAERLDAIRAGSLDFATDRKDLEAFLPVVTEASSSKQTADRLARYRVARKRAVSTQVQRTRTETRRGWDRYDTSCDAWYESPIGCAVTRRVEVPYTERRMVMRYPDGISSPTEILKAYQDRYFDLLGERRRTNSSEAERERQAIMEGQVAGWAGLYQSILIGGGFLVLMFFFLLVAIERHQRRLTVQLSQPVGSTPADNA